MIFRYNVTFHLAAGVNLNFNTDEQVRYEKLLKKPNNVFVFTDQYGKKQMVASRSVLAIEIVENNRSTKRKEKQNGEQE